MAISIQIPIAPGDSSQTVEYKVALAREAVMQSAEIDALALYRDYYEGDHRLLLSDDQKALFENIIGRGEDGWPVDNKCRKVVDKVRSRLNVTGWRDSKGSEVEISDDDSDNAPTGTSTLKTASLWWTENDMDRWEGEIYKAALRDGEAYLNVDFPKGGAVPRFTFQQRYDGQTGIRMVYQDEAKTKPVYAVKYWSDIDPQSAGFGGGSLGIPRATVYTANAVYKYARLSGRQRDAYEIAGTQTPDGWTPIKDSGDATWPVQWLDTGGKPLGLGVVPFVSPRGSLIKHVVGLNNALNKTNIDLLLVADQSGFGVAAIQYEKMDHTKRFDEDDDPAGDGLGLRPGSVIETEGKVVKLPADDMAGLLNYARHLTVSIASNSDIPLHEFVPVSGEVPSGAALQMLDSALSQQAAECSVWFGSSWRQVMDLAQKLVQVYGSLDGEPTTITPVWADTAYVDPVSEEQNRTQMATRVKTLVDAGVPIEVALRREGWTDEELSELASAKEKEQEAAQNSLASALATQQRRFDQNQMPQMNQAGQMTPAQGGKANGAAK